MPQQATQRHHRITELRIKGMRCIGDLRLPLGGIKVLIGENGSGKSTVLEALEILRKLSSVDAWRAISSTHGGIRALARSPGEPISLGVTVVTHQMVLEYDISIGGELDWGLHQGIRAERLVAHDREPGAQPRVIFNRSDASQAGARAPFRRSDGRETATRPQLTDWDRGVPDVAQIFMRAALEAIEVHVPFDSVPQWCSRELGRESPLRSSNVLQPTERLDRLGGNLANAYHSLKNDYSHQHWQETLDIVRAGVGTDLDSINLVSDAAGGKIGLFVRFQGGLQLPAFALSDGTLAYLAFVALTRLQSQRSLLAFDEPEIHLHPTAIARVVALLELTSADAPVLITTHSDALLDSLSDPARSAVLCSLDQSRSMTAMSPAPDELARWMQKYRGLGAIRSEGYERLVMRRPLSQ